MRIDRTGLSITLAVHALVLYGALHQAPIQRKLVEVAPLLVRIIAPAAPKHIEPPKRALSKPSAPRLPSLELPPIAIAPPAPPRPAVLPIATPTPAPEAPRSEPRIEREAPAAITPPVFNANYLDNPAPAYPAPSRRMREQGRVILRVLVRTNGTAAQVQVRTSSGYARLDDAARDAVLHWRFAPARRGAEPIEEWVLIPVSFRLDS